jgi:hypothetical protein
MGQATRGCQTLAQDVKIKEPQAAMALAELSLREMLTWGGARTVAKWTLVSIENKAIDHVLKAGS